MVYGVKRCSTCGEEKPLGEFYHQHKERGNRKGQCKDCVRAYTRERYYKFREEILAKQKEYEARPEVAAHKRVVRNESSRLRRIRNPVRNRSREEKDKFNERQRAYRRARKIKRLLAIYGGSQLDHRTETV